MGADKWKFAAPLPRGLYWVASASLRNSVLIIGWLFLILDSVLHDGLISLGGYDGTTKHRAEILEFDGTGNWRHIATMDKARQGSAAQAYDLQRFKSLNLAECL